MEQEEEEAEQEQDDDGDGGNEEKGEDARRIHLILSAP